MSLTNNERLLRSKGCSHTDGSTRASSDAASALTSNHEMGRGRAKITEPPGQFPATMRTSVKISLGRPHSTQELIRQLSKSSSHSR